MQLSDAASGVLSFGGLQTHNGPIIRFETGSIILKLRDPEVGINLMQTYYGASLSDELDGFYKFKMDLSRSPVAQTMALIRYANAHSEDTVTDLAFSSYPALQTFVLSLDMIKRFPELAEALEYNEIGLQAVEFNDSRFRHDAGNGDFDPTSELDINGVPVTPNNIEDCNLNPVESWWLQETNTFQAWDYSIGTGARDWEAFQIGDTHYLALANFGYTNASQTPSQLFKWTGSQFEAVQDFPYAVSTSWTHVLNHDRHYLMLSSYEQDGNRSRLFRWNGSEFVLQQVLENSGAIDWTFFNVGGMNYFAAMSNYYSTPGNYSADSKIYRFE